MREIFLRLKNWAGPYNYSAAFISLIILMFTLPRLRAFTYDYSYGGERIRFFLTGLTVAVVVAIPLFLALKLSETFWKSRKKSLLVYFLELAVAVIISMITQFVAQKYLIPRFNIPNFLEIGSPLGEFVIRFIFAIIFVAFTHSRQRSIQSKLSAAAVINNELQLRYSSLIDADEEIRTLASRLLHDRIQSKLMLAGARLTRISEMLTDEGRLGIKPVIKELEQIRSIDVREVSQLLTPNLAGEGLIGSCENLCGEYRSEVHFSIDIEEEIEMLEDEIKLGIYRIIEQGVINSIKHGPAKNVQITVKEGAKASHFIEIKDDGPGCADVASGKGTVIIDSWVSKLGGSKEIESTPGNGFTLRVRVP